jgi:hypothetical protein
MPRPRYIGDLVFNRLADPSTYVQAVPDGSTVTADRTMTLTDDVAGVNGIPADGSVVAVMVHVWHRSTVGSDATVMELMDYDNPRALGVAVDSGDGHHGWHTYSGHVAGHHGVNTFERIYTGGKNNTQFKYGISSVPGSSTTTFYIRIMGYWTRAD